MLTNFSKYLLHDNELVRYKREVSGKVLRTGVSLNVQHGVGKAEQVTKNGIVLVVYLLQCRFHFRLFLQNTFLDNFVCGRRSQRKSGLETGLNTRELIFTSLDDFIDSFLTGTNNPNLAAALTADFLNKRLQVDKKVCVATYILSNLIDHKQQSEVIWLIVHIFFHLRNKLCDAGLHGLGSIEPVTCSILAHAENFFQCINNIVFKESEGISGLKPRTTIFLLKYTTELCCLSTFFDELLQLCHLKILSIEAKVVIEHLCKNTKNSSLVLVDGTFNIDIEKNGVCMALGNRINQHECCRVILKLFTESFYGTNTLNLLIGKQVGKHFQEVRFTTSKETGNPNSDICGAFSEGLTIIIKEGNKMLLQISGNDILVQFLNKNICGILVYFNDAIDFTINIILE